MGELADILLPAGPAPQGAFYWATVTSVSPLQVRLDGETVPLNIKPVTLVYGLSVGDRVWCQLNKRQLLIIKSANDERVLWANHARAQFYGGGVRKATTTAISWSKRFMATGMGTNPYTAANGYFNIDMPPDGTVIPTIGVTGGGSVTVSGGMVPLAAWQSLWYILPFGSGAARVDANFFIASYSQPHDTFGPNAICLAMRNGDEGPNVVWGDGRETQPWQGMALTNSWANYGSGYTTARYKRENGLVMVEGLIKSGTLGSAGIFTLPVGYRPDSTLQWTTNSSGGVADIRCFSTGVFCVYALYSGTNASVSISVPPFPADA